MPNHVYNYLTVTSQTPEELQAFLDKSNQTFIGRFQDFLQEGHPIVEKEISSPFSFRAFVPTPTGNEYDEHLDDEGKLQQPWYNWNIGNWGTKWDAYDLEIERVSDTHANISFTTAWNQPTPVFVAMASQHPELVLRVHYEEEQGWGGKLLKPLGHDDFFIEEEWDIPNSHADYVKRDNVESCPCQSEPNHKEYWYDDCPGKLPPHECNCEGHKNDNSKK